jgi:hypothetical protein
LTSSSSARRAALFSSANVVRPSRAHSIKRSAMNLRLS